MFWLNTKGLVALAENHQVGWRLIQVENWDNKKLQETDIAESDFLMKLTLLLVILTLNNV